MSDITHLCANFQMLTKLPGIIHASFFLGWEVRWLGCSPPLHKMGTVVAGLGVPREHLPGTLTGNH